MTAIASTTRRARFAGVAALLVVFGHATAIQADAGAVDGLTTDTHAAADVENRTAAFGDDYRVEEMYSCDRDAVVVGGRNSCRVSLLLTHTGTGAHVVVDRDQLLNPAVYAGAAQSDFPDSIECSCVADDEAQMMSDSRNASLASSR